jgi:hypothetical protein
MREREKERKREREKERKREREKERKRAIKIDCGRLKDVGTNLLSLSISTFLLLLIQDKTNHFLTKHFHCSCKKIIVITVGSRYRDVPVIGTHFFYSI